LLLRRVLRRRTWRSNLPLHTRHLS
jgi:hypothetical protein